MLNTDCLDEFIKSAIRLACILLNKQLTSTVLSSVKISAECASVVKKNRSQNQE